MGDIGTLLLRELPGLQARARTLERGEAAAEDLVQDTLERALRKGQQGLIGEDLRRWLMVVMQNLFTDRWRKRVRLRDQPGGDLAYLPDPASAPARGEAEPPSAAERATLADVRAALSALGEPLRTAFELRFFERLSYQEVAARTGVPVRTVGTRILRARLRVQKAFAADDTGACA